MGWRPPLPEQLLPLISTRFKLVVITYASSSAEQLLQLREIEQEEDVDDIDEDQADAF